MPAGRSSRLVLPLSRLPTGASIGLPMAILHGRREGPAVFVSAGVHGDELNGIEVIRRLLRTLSPRGLRGTVIAVPVVNVFGFFNQTRYLPDRRDLNRSFPGSDRGSLAAQLARLFFDEVVTRCRFGIDLHTAAVSRTNLPQIRCDFRNAELRELGLAFGAPVCLDSHPGSGTLRAAAASRGVGVLTYEAGEALRFSRLAVERGLVGVQRVLARLGVLEDLGEQHPIASVESRSSTWVRAGRGGMFLFERALGERVEKGERLGELTEVFRKDVGVVRARTAGIQIGHATNPIVNRGDALVHIAVVEEPPTA